MSRAGAALLAVAASAALAGCLHPAPRPAPDEGAWPRVRDANTRSVQLYDELAMRAFATATWESPEVRAARVDRVAAWKGMTVEERAALKASEDAAAAEFEEFTVSVLTADRNDNDLDAPRSSWRVALVRDEGEALPVQVRAVTADALVRTLYPRIGDFDTVYRVRFRRGAGAPLGQRAFLLRMAGPRGRLDFPFGPGTIDPRGTAPRSPDAAGRSRTDEPPGS